MPSPFRRLLRRALPVAAALAPLAGAFAQAAATPGSAPPPAAQPAPQSSPQSSGGVVRSVLPDGRVIYSDAPAQGAKSTREVPIQSQQGNTTGISEKDIKSSNQRAAAKNAAIEKARARELAALNKLEAAKKAKAEGVEPLPGERLGNAGGHSRLSNAYWARQKRLEAAVTRAQKEYDDAGYAYRQAL
jgi:hypothetical protein